MLNQDDLLQKKLDQLESGVPLETVLKDLPAEVKELEMLIRLAAAVRNAPHPVPADAQVSTQRRELLAAAAAKTLPAAKTHPAAKTLPAARNKQPVAKARPAWNWLTAGALLAAAGAMALFIVLVLLSASFWFSTNDMDSARVEYLNGQVQVATNRAGTNWKNIEAGARLHAGARLRTLGASNATLVFYEGTHTFVSPDSELAITELNGSAGNTIQVKIDQSTGETWNKVTPFKDNSKSFFLVQTPSGTASVHGTSFNVKVSETGQSQFAVDTGELLVKNSTSEVTLLAGQATMADPDGAIAAPTYQFSVQGSLLSIDTVESGTLWIVSGAQFKVTDATQITGDPQLGDTIKVTGRILEGNIWVADSIEPGTGEGQVASYTGWLEKNDGEFWIIGGQTVQVTPETELDPNLAINDPVKVTYNIINDGGTWLALKIESLVEEEQPAPIPTATADPNAMPSYAFDPDELETRDCGNTDFNFTGTLRNTSDEAKDYAANVQLGYRFDSGGDFVSSVMLTPSSWERIEAGQTVSFNIHLTMKEEWVERSSAEDLQVKMRIFVASATNRPDHLTGRLTVTIAAGCQVPLTQTMTATPTVTQSGTLTPDTTGTPTATPTVTPSIGTNPEPEGQCTGADPHPTGLKLAQRYGVPYEEIMGWFCQHYGFGEIDLAYSLSRQTGTPVEEIFAMRASGMGWGDIKKTLLNGGDGQNDNENDKNKDKEKDKDKKKDKYLNFARNSGKMQPE